MKKMIIALLFATLCTHTIQANSPNDVTAATSSPAPEIKKGCYISGHVIEKKSEENIPFANIYIQETKQGTISILWINVL